MNDQEEKIIKYQNKCIFLMWMTLRGEELINCLSKIVPWQEKIFISAIGVLVLH